jgi:hypothetical protein
MSKTLAELNEIAGACMADRSPTVISYHHNAADNAARAADPKRTRPGSPAQAWARDAEATALLSALTTTHGAELNTAELLLTAALIASRANGEELRLQLQPASEGQRHAVQWLHRSAEEMLGAFGGQLAPDWLRPAAEELENALFYFSAHGPKGEGEELQPAAEAGPYSAELAEAFRQGARELQLDCLEIEPGAAVTEAPGGGGAFVACRVFVSDGERLPMPGEEIEASEDECSACGRESLDCSRDPCPAVIADRAA